MSIDRAVTERLDPVWVAGRLEHPASRAVVASTDGVLVTGDRPVSLMRVPLPARANHPADEVWPVMLGLEDDIALFAIDLEVQPPNARRRLNERGRIATLREAGRVLAPQEAGLAAYLVALLNWHRRHRFCPGCGPPCGLATPGSRGRAQDAARSISRARTRPSSC